MRKFFKNNLYFLPLVVLAMPFLASAAGYAPTGLPVGQPITFLGLDNIIGILMDFIIGISGVVMIGSIVLSGFMVMTSGSNSKQYEKGITWLRHAVIGSAVVLGVGVIINTVAGFVSGAFFCQLSVVGICLWY